MLMDVSLLSLPFVKKAFLVFYLKMSHIARKTVFYLYFTSIF